MSDVLNKCKTKEASADTLPTFSGFADSHVTHCFQCKLKVFGCFAEYNLCLEQ
jgi:hypothetical protein